MTILEAKLAAQLIRWTASWVVHVLGIVVVVCDEEMAVAAELREKLQVELTKMVEDGVALDDAGQARLVARVQEITLPYCNERGRFVVYLEPFDPTDPVQVKKRVRRRFAREATPLTIRWEEWK